MGVKRLDKDEVQWKREGLSKPSPKSDREYQTALKDLNKPPNGKSKQRIIFEK